MGLRSGMRWRAASVALVVAMALSLTAEFADGERTQSGNLIVSLNGGIDPLRLPRHRTAPVTVHLEGAIRTSDGSPLPRVKRVKFELAGQGRLSTRGLAVCPRARLRNADNHQALSRCREALVGDGSLEAAVFIPTQSPFTIHARLLAFNGRTSSGRVTIWVHAFSSDPPVSLVLPFVVRPGRGVFHTALVATIPRSVGPFPHLAVFQLTLSRRFAYRGRQLSYLRASCPVPRPFTAGFLSFARATYGFEAKRSLSVESVRSCRAR